MRIGLLSFEMTASGGEQRQVLQLAKCLRDAGHESFVFACRSDSEVCYPDLIHQIPVRSLEQQSQVRVVPGTKAVSMLSSAVRRYFVEARRMAPLLEGVNILNPHGRPAHRAAVFAKVRTGAPVVWSCNDVVSWEKPGHRVRMSATVQALASAVMRPVERRLVRQVDQIAALDRNSMAILQQTYGRPVQIVRTGLDTDVLAPNPEGRQRIRERHKIAPGEYLMLWLGIFEPFRRLEDLVEAMGIIRNSHPGIRLLVVGRQDTSPVYARHIVNLVSAHGLNGRIEFVSKAVPETEVPEYYSACDVFAFPNDHQSWGMAPLEALACGSPVIVSRGSGVHEVLADGETALLVPPREPAAIARALVSLSRNPELARKIACQGRQFALREFSWRRYAAQMIDLFRATLEAAKPAGPRTARREAFA